VPLLPNGGKGFRLSTGYFSKIPTTHILGFHKMTTNDDHETDPNGSHVHTTDDAALWWTEAFPQWKGKHNART
jgi:hypothetical protein